MSQAALAGARRWLGYDWGKLAVAGALAAALIRVGPGGAAATPLPTASPAVAATTAPTLPPTALPSAVATSTPSAAPTEAATAAPTPAPTETPAAPGATGAELAVTVPAEGSRLAPGTTAVRGTGRPGSVIEVLNSDQVLAETTVGDDGTWAAQVDLPEGTAVISVRVKGTDNSVAPVQVAVGNPEEERCASLAVGCQVWVTRAGGLRLRLRASPAILSGNIISRLPIGTQMELLAGPTAADGYSWWRVRTLGGQEGWASGENMVLQPD